MATLTSTPRSSQPLLTLASGPLVTFAAFGFGSWFSGATSWIAFYLGARDQTLATIAQAAAAAGFALAVVTTCRWYHRRCQRGQSDIPAKAALVACLILPLGSIFWAIFTDAIAYHHGQDIVRPAFDNIIMYLVLAGLPLLTVGAPLLILHLRRRKQSPIPTAACPLQ